MRGQTAILILFLLFFLMSCYNETTSDVKDGRGSFSYKSGHLAFTYFKNNVASIYYTTSIDSVAKKLTFPKTGWDLTFDLSQDLSKILYINYPKGDYEICNICLYDLKSGKSDTLLNGGQLITNACISNDNKFVYFLNASEIKNYSPIATKAPHGVDIYEINVQTKSIRKLTNLNAYGIQALTSTFSDSIIGANVYDKSGLVTVSTKTGELKEIKINSPRNDVKEYFIPVDLRQDSMIYEAPYELYRYNLKTDKSELILRSPTGHFGVIQADNSWTNILFDNGDKLYSYNIPNKKLTEVELKLE
jgi:hypothetical protein